MSTVLVTGGAGFIGSHCIALLLEAGHRVRATVRGHARESALRTILQALGPGHDAPVGCFHAHLEGDEGWAEAAAGCDYVLHIASPLPLAEPLNQSALVVPARDGTLRVLRAARDAGVRRVVMTSSFAAIGYGCREIPPCFDETFWTDPMSPVSAYIKSKTLAEQAAWQFIGTEGEGMELTSINPVSVLGPVPVIETSASIEMVKRLLEGRVPACPRIWFGVVDVRDVAELHLRAMTEPLAAGERFLACAGNSLSVQDLSRILAAALPEFAPRLPRRVLPDWTVRALSMIRPELGRLRRDLGLHKQISNAKARRILDWHPRPNSEAIIETARSLARLGLVTPPPHRSRPRVAR